MKKMIVVMITALLGMMLIAGCTDAQRAKVGGLGDRFTIEMLTMDGKVYRTYTSSGKVSSEANSDGYFFMDQETGKLTEVTGWLVITQE